MSAAAVARRQSGRNYGCLACQKSTVAALYLQSNLHKVFKTVEIMTRLDFVCYARRYFKMCIFLFQVRQKDILNATPDLLIKNDLSGFTFFVLNAETIISKVEILIRIVHYYLR